MTAAYEYSQLSPADDTQFQSFTTTDWAGLSVLLVDDVSGRHQYPNITDWIGLLPEARGGNHPLLRVEEALAQEALPSWHVVRQLAFQTGQTIHPGQPDNPADWEKDDIAKLWHAMPAVVSEQPQSDWQKADYQDLYERVRKYEAEQLTIAVHGLTDVIIAQNESDQLFVAKIKKTSHDREQSSGWLAPLVGLTINTAVTNDYDEQVHTVNAVVRQTDMSSGLWPETSRALYTLRRNIL